MSGPAWNAALGVILTLLLNLATFAFAWGRVNSTVNRLKEDVEGLQKEMKGLQELEKQVARMAERQDMWIEQLKEISASIRWMREPAPPYRPSTLPRGTTDK